MFGKVARHHDQPKLFVGGPFAARLRGFGFAAPAEQRSQPRPGRRPLGPAFERQGDLVPFGRGADPQVDVMLERRRERRARNRGAEPARELGNRGDLRQGQRLADVAAGLALQRLELGIGADQPSGLVEPSEDRPRFVGDASHWPFPSDAAAER